MSNFETNELRPDSSDRPNQRRQPKSSFTVDLSKLHELLEKVNLSRQHLMIGIGAIVLLVIVITLLSSLGGKPAEDGPTSPQQITFNVPNENQTDASNTDLQQSGSPQQIQPPSMVDSQQNVLPTQADTQQPPSQGQQQVNISERVTNAVSPQTQSSTNVTTNANNNVNTNSSKPVNDTKPATTKPSSLASLPSGQVTLQLSGATKPDSLEAFAKKHNLSNYWVYETRRDGKPWFVLIHGTYANAQEANKAAATLPADIQSKKPWVKPIKQVQQESKQR